MGIKTTIGTNGDGQPRVTFTADGDGDVYRFAWQLAHTGQLDTAKRIFRYLKRRWKSDIFVEHDRRVTEGKVTEYGWDRRS